MPHVSAATWQEQSQNASTTGKKTFLGALTSVVSLKQLQPSRHVVER